MLTIAIEFKNNRGSFALDAIAQTIGGNWSGKSSTDDSGIITDVDPDNREWAVQILNEDDNVVSYNIDDEE